ncbi:MAG: hypothetical protein RML45_02250 [Acetobacteraceae bacterium]|nr:hypothetical protein [Acetobacteraceae bacterium]
MSASNGCFAQNHPDPVAAAAADAAGATAVLGFGRPDSMGPSPSRIMRARSAPPNSVRTTARAAPSFTRSA